MTTRTPAKLSLSLSIALCLTLGGLLGLLRRAGAAAPPAANGKIAFESTRDGNSEIYVMNPDGSYQTDLTNNPANDYEPAWSPNGQALAFTSLRDGITQIYVMNADGSNQTRLTHTSAHEGSAAFSPDGTKIAFASDRDGNYEIYVMNADGSNPVNLSATPGMDDSAPSWSPDGQALAFHSYQGYDGGIFVMNADGTGRTQLTQPPYGSLEFNASWSPDGSKILFQSDRDQSLPYELYTVAPDGSNLTRLTFNFSPEQRPSYSPDGSKIVFWSFGNGADIFVSNADGSNRIQLTNTVGTDRNPAWQPAPPSAGPSGRIVFQSFRGGNTDIYAADADGSNLARLTDAPGRDYQPVYSPDGSKIVFTSERSGLEEVYVMNADGSNQTQLTTNGSSANNISFSPDGTKVVFQDYLQNQDQYDICIVNIDGTGFVNLTHDQMFEDKPVWSPDGSKIVYEDYSNQFTSEVYSINPDGTGKVNLTNNPSNPDYNPVWSPDGSKIAYVGNYEGVRVMNANGTGKTSLTNNGNDNNPTWSPDGSKIAFTRFENGKTAVYSMNADGTSQRLLTALAAAGYQRAEWSPDGSALAFVTTRDGDSEVYVMNADGSAQRNVSNNHPGSDSGPHWQASGNTPAGANVTVDLGGVRVNFAAVTTAGNTTATPIDPATAGLVPGGYSVSGSTAYEIQTTASYTPPVVTCFVASSVTDPAAFAALRVLHSEGGVLVDRTILAPDSPAPDFTSKTVCARTTSLSPFVLASLSDTAPPTTNANASPQPNAAGWNNSAVSVTLTATDEAGGSGVRSITYSASGAQTITTTTIESSSVTFNVTAEGTTTVSYRATDNAGNIETPHALAVKIDRTPPAVNIISPAETAYTVGQAVAAHFQCSDAGAGLLTCSGTVGEGSPVDTATPGAKTFTVNSSDAADNASAKTVNYQVAYGVRALYDQTKAHHSGSVVPVKLQLTNAGGANLSSAGLVVTALSTTLVSGNSTGAVEDAGNANPDLNFRYDPALGGYIFNLKTTGYLPGTYLLNFSVAGDPVTHYLQFRIAQ